MIKIISLVVFIGTLILTWAIFNSKTDLGIGIHSGIQERLTLLIEDTIRAKRPNAGNFNLIKMYTEKIEADKVKAVFSYEYDDVLQNDENAKAEGVTQKINGEAILVHSISEDPTIQKWVVQTVKTDNQSLDFKDGLSITGDSKSTPEPEENKEPPKTESKENH